MSKIRPNKRKHYFQQPEEDIDIPNGDPAYGKQVFAKFCAGCHNLDDNGNMGPALKDVYLRKAGHKAGFRFSISLAKANFRWTKQRLFIFLEDPEAMVPDTLMIFDGMRDPWDRACVIEYLHYLKDAT